jgi:DNA-binding LytR/AlgR family response regulator
MTYSCIAVDDEPLALEKIISLIGKIPLLEMKATFSNAEDALIYLSCHRTDILFLDIQMEAMTGLDLLSALRVQPQVVLITAYQEYALRGYEFEVCDYILKPYSFDRLALSVQKAIKRIPETRIPADFPREFIFVKTDYRLVKIMLSDILYIEGMRDFRNIVTTKGKILTQQTFGSLESQLSNHQFIRIHKSYMVALSKIESIEKHRVQIGSVLLPVSESYREKFYQSF